MAADTNGVRSSDGRRLWACVCAALGAHALLAIFFAQPAPALPEKPVLQWIELTEDTPARPGPETPVGVRRSETRHDRNVAHARRAIARAARARGHEVATEKRIASVQETSTHAAHALEDGTQQRAAESPSPGAAAAGPSRAAALTGGVANGTLATRAVLVASSVACNGFFPALAPSDDGVVTLSMSVAPSGRVHAGRVLDERPLGEGFGDAARRCLHRVRFQPALDRQGQPVASTSVLRLRFARHPGARRRLTAALGH